MTSSPRPFWKMHGAGNDFILFDDRDQTFPCTHQARIEEIATPKYGIGSEGVILIQPSDSADFRMRFFNPDGNEVEMCGNGARCVARLAHELNVAPEQMTFDTVAGVIGATILSDDRVRLDMTPPEGRSLNRTLTVEGKDQIIHFVNSGVPHVVMETDSIGEIDLTTLGPAIRYHDAFAPAGTNLNLFQVLGPDHLRVRTYERGVEAETLACGTGIVACGLVAGTLGRVTTPVKITCASGDILEVDYTMGETGPEQVTLTGPAVHVFSGEIVV
jgi:diaminopimelate epimerase